MSFRDWSDEQYEEFQNEAYASVYNNLPTVPYLDDTTDSTARELFAEGWLTFGEYTPEELYAIREQFYDLINIQESQFDWQDYRDLYAEVNG